MGLSIKKKGMLIAIAGVLITVSLLTYRALGSKDQALYQTAKVERGMIVSSISASGQIDSNNVAVTTQASGVIREIHVKEGDIVKAGDKLVTIELDRDGRIAKSKAWASYLSAKSALEAAKKNDLVVERDMKSAEIELSNAEQSKLALQRELTLAKSSLIAAQDAWDSVKDKPQTNSERQQKELALQAAQHAVDLAQKKYDHYDSNAVISWEQGKLLLEKELVSAKAALESAQAAYDAALESTSTTDSERRQKELALQATQSALDLSQSKYDNYDNSNAIDYQQSKLSLQRELESAKAALLAAQDAWDAVKNKPASDADRRQAELALHAARDAVGLAQRKYDSADASIERADLGISIAKQNAKSDNTAVAKAQADVDAARLFYQATLPTVTAPASGRVTDLNLFVGMAISGNSSSGGLGSSSGGQRIATIASDTKPIATFNISEVDVVKVKPGQKATLALDALPGKTFTGKVIGIDRTGTVSSGVTTYLASIQFDSGVDDIHSNMAVSASIITETKDDVLLIPSSASRTLGGQALVTILKNGEPQQIPVTIGLYSDSQVEVVSGLSDGDEIVIETLSGSQGQPKAGSPSPFGGRGISGGGMRPGGGGAFIVR